MEVLIEKFLLYGVAILLVLTVLYVYIRKMKKESRQVDEKIKKAKESGLHEPVSLHPVVNPYRCIKSGACIEACHEKDILGIRNGRATIINASLCIGHGACFHACPVEAITLCIGTEKRGVDLPHVSPNFETNVPGIYIAGELGGMGLIKNAVTQGYEAVENISKTISKENTAMYDLIIIGAGPAGISASLAAKKLNLNALTLEQDTLGGTVFTFPRAKIVMTSPMNLPLHGKIKLNETSKKELLEIWQTVLSNNKISIKENSKVESIGYQDGIFSIETQRGEHFTSKTVLLSIGRRGTPRKLNIPGEHSEKVAYRLLEPEAIHGKRIVVVGGGDSAIESALLLADENKVSLSYRSASFNRIKPKNAEKINEAISKGKIEMLFGTQIVLIEDGFIQYKNVDSAEVIRIENDLVYIFAGGELPTQFLQKIGIDITTKRGEAILKH
jgi:thioredoxin reductase/NAD-dependent dihydropyrimidine dehydrogenase PreA subunit